MRRPRLAVCAVLCAVIGAIGHWPAVVHASETPDDATVVQVKSLESQPMPQVQAVLGPHKGGCNRCAPERDCECRYWDFKLDLGAATGNSTFGDNEGQYYRFEQRLHTPRGNQYGFYETYNIEHNFLNTRDWGIGADQRIPDFWNDSELRMSEDYEDYTDRDFADERRKQTDFRVRLNPQWMDGHVRTNLDYRLRNVEYPNLPTESYVMHDLRLSGQYDVDHTATASGDLRYAHYNYALGNGNSNNLLHMGGRIDYKLDEDLTAYVEGNQDDKRYNSRKDRNYQQDELGAGFNWKTDCDSTLSGDVSHTAYDRPYNPLYSYDEWNSQLRFRRQLSCALDADLRAGYRTTHYDIDPLNNLRSTDLNAQFNYAPEEDWNMTGTWGRHDYHYADPLRAYVNSIYALGYGYHVEHGSAGFNWRRSVSDYAGAPQFSNTKDDFDFDFTQDDCNWRWRGYAGVGRLTQNFPGTGNNYNEQRLGFEWSYDFSCATTLTVDYDHSKRAYVNANNRTEDNRLQANLTYKW
jgi:hypothetical protein